MIYHRFLTSMFVVSILFGSGTVFGNAQKGCAACANKKQNVVTQQSPVAQLVAKTQKEKPSQAKQIAEKNKKREIVVDTVRAQGVGAFPNITVNGDATIKGSLYTNEIDPTGGSKVTCFSGDVALRPDLKFLVNEINPVKIVTTTNAAGKTSTKCAPDDSECALTCFSANVCVKDHRFFMQVGNDPRNPITITNQDTPVLHVKFKTPPTNISPYCQSPILVRAYFCGRWLPCGNIEECRSIVHLCSFLYSPSCNSVITQIPGEPTDATYLNGSLQEGSSECDPDGLRCGAIPAQDGGVCLTLRTYNCDDCCECSTTAQGVVFFDIIGSNIDSITCDCTPIECC
jgi:hypothetical protein